MGRKSAAKTQGRDNAAPHEPKRSLPQLLILAILAIAAAIGVFAFMRTGPDANANGAASQSAAADQQKAAAEAAVPEVALKPHPQASLPPLPFSPAPPARPAQVVREVYKFAAEHPEVLSYVPCYCGCERSGHRGNEDCFVTARDEKGDVTDWEPHGMT
jgi:Protein of unknown function with PCYCGC motif